MLAELDTIQTEALAAIRGIADEATLEEVRVGFLGKKGRLTVASAGMRDVPADLKKDVGQKLNEVRTAITDPAAFAAFVKSSGNALEDKAKQAA